MSVLSCRSRRHSVRGFGGVVGYIFQFNKNENHRPSTISRGESGTSDGNRGAMGMIKAPILETRCRNNSFGRVIEINSIGEGGGSGFRHDMYEIACNHYLSIGQKPIFACRAKARGAQGDVPFFALCKLGSAEDIRGHKPGRYQDRATRSTLAEDRPNLRVDYAPGKHGSNAFYISAPGAFYI